MTTDADTFARLNGASTVLLTSFKRNGEGVGTPLGFVVADGKLYFATRDSTWKVKRLARNPQVMIAPCTRQGKPLDQAIAAVARPLTGVEAQRARAIMRRTFGQRLWGGLFVLIYKLIAPRDQWIVYEVTPIQETTAGDKV